MAVSAVLALMLLSYEYQHRGALFRRDGGCRQPPVPVMPMRKIWIDGERAIRCSKGCREGGEERGGKGRRGEGRAGAGGGAEIRLESGGAETETTKGANEPRNVQRNGWGGGGTKAPLDVVKRRIYSRYGFM